MSALRAGLANLTASDGKLSRVRAAEVIADLRFGKSVAAKATLLARLERGPVAATPESGKQFTAELTILFDRAAAALAAYPRSDHVAALRGPAPADERTRLMRQAKPGRLPDAADVPELHAVAADLRRLRDEVGVRLDDGLGEPPTAAQTASWEELRREADELTRTAARLASRAVPGTAEETAQRAVLLPLQTLADLWRPIRIEQAMIRVATVDVLTASSRDLLMRVKFRAAGQPSEVDERAARIGRQLRTAAEHLARGETIPANGAVQAAITMILTD